MRTLVWREPQRNLRRRELRRRGLAKGANMRFYIVDCFAEEKYQGNELLAIVADRPVSDGEQQAIAREINFSETSFILSGKQPDGGYDVRIWTPNVGEVPFAGHPTLGTAYVIYHILEEGRGSEVRLNLKVGQIPVRVTGAGMTMMQNPPVFGETIDPAEIAEIYSIDEADILDDYPVMWVSTGLDAVIVPLRTREALARLICDRDRFAAYIHRHPACNCNHLFFVDEGRAPASGQAFAPAQESTPRKTRISARCLMEDFVEDPATGSANGDLAAYLLRCDYFGSKDVRYTVRQGEDMGRPSVLQVHAALRNGSWTIEVGGNCYVVAQGDWL